MEWVTELPTAEGWYWMRWPGGTTEVVEVVTGPAGEMKAWGASREYPFVFGEDIEPGTLWAGPLQPPPLPPAPPA